MKWTYVAAVGALVGGLAVAVRRRSSRAQPDADLWAKATDPVARFGN